MIALVLLNSIILGLQNFGDPENKSERNRVLMKIIEAFDYLFIAEMLLKIIAFGAWSLPTTYFKKHWNLFDFFLALVGAVQIFAPLFAS